MKVVKGVLMGLFLAGCQPERKEENVTQKWALAPILSVVPESSFLVNLSYQGRVVLDLKVDGGNAVWIRNGAEVQNGWEDVEVDLFQKSAVLRVWSRAETEYHQVRQSIRKALRAEMTDVHFVVKDINGEFGVLEIGHPIEGELPELVPVILFVKQDGSVSINNESGMIEDLVDEKALRERLELHRSVSEISGVKSVIQVRASDSLSYGRFVKVIAICCQTIAEVKLTDWSRNPEPPKARFKPDRIQRKPSPPVPSFPSLPEYR